MQSEDKSITEIVIVCWGSTFYASRTSEPSVVKRDLQRLSTEDPEQVTTVAKVLRLRLPLSYATTGPLSVVERDKTLAMVATWWKKVK